MVAQSAFSGEACLLGARDITCRRGGWVLFRDLSFELAAGGALLLTGPNGSGKSSLLRILAGLLKPAAGQVLWRGGAVTDDPEAFQAEMHYVGHLDAVKPAFTVTENLAFWARLRGGSGGAPAAALERFGLAGLADLPAGFLSAGQRRRLGLARVLAAPARLWLLDEPTVSLDRDAVAALAAVIAEHRSGGGAVIAATHLALGVADAQTLTLGGDRHGAGVSHDLDPEFADVALG